MPGSRRHADEAFMTALACGATVESAAHKAGISLRTATRRLANPDFCKRLKQMRSDMVQRTTGTLTAASTEAVKTLLTLQQQATPPTVRLGAARAILEMAVKYREITDLAERIEALEEQARMTDPPN